MYAMSKHMNEIGHILVSRRSINYMDFWNKNANEIKTLYYNERKANNNTNQIF